MDEMTDAEGTEIEFRVLHAKADAALRLISRVIGELREDHPELPTMQEFCKSVVSGTLNDPAAAFALAEYTDGYPESMKVQQAMRRMMLEDERKHQKRPG